MLGGRFKMRTMRVLALSAVLGIACTNVACVATANSAPPRGIVVNGPPPAPISEARSAPPSATAAWVNGYWHWEGARYVWIPGHWENAPPGAQWYAPRYSQNTDGRFFYEPGGWSPGNQPVGSQPPGQPAGAPANTASAFH